MPVSKGILVTPPKKVETFATLKKNNLPWPHQMWAAGWRLIHKRALEVVAPG
jgi:hypothetical protein